MCARTTAIIFLNPALYLLRSGSCSYATKNACAQANSNFIVGDCIFDRFIWKIGAFSNNNRRIINARVTGKHNTCNCAKCKLGILSVTAFISYVKIRQNIDLTSPFHGGKLTFFICKIPKLIQFFRVFETELWALILE